MESAKKIHQNEYANFDQLNGFHPLQTTAPNTHILYKARKRPGGRVAYFNFDLAKELGLIDQNHPKELNACLQEKILSTFAITIINEYDQINNTPIPSSWLLSGEYMATRYLQLQHPSKKGTTSGDGRSIWNGSISHKGTSWDISSCGTGATKLSPATNINNKFYQTGDPSVSYGCGYSEIDEGMSSLFFSEILNQNGYSTERILAVIEFAKGISINIRAHKNLLRPSHFFCHVKQGNYAELFQLTEYYIERERANGKLKQIPQKDLKKRYDCLLDYICHNFATTVARFEDDYIFCWLDWDGDNILMDGGIIDYGSVRQFGLFHNEYRYDDVQRYSTTITEQKNKAKYLIQTFAQMMDFLVTKQKKNINKFSRHKILSKFDRYFLEQKRFNLMQKIGFDHKVAHTLTEKFPKLIDKFRTEFSYFERAKSVKGMHKVPDGITWDAIFCMRDILRELPQMYLHRGQTQILDQEFIDIIKSNYASKKDLTIGFTRKRHIASYQKLYVELIKKVCQTTHQSFQDVLMTISTRSAVINKYDRVTGDSISLIVEKVIKSRPKLQPIEIEDIVKQFTGLQTVKPEDKKVITLSNPKQKRYISSMLKIVREYSEGI